MKPNAQVQYIDGTGRPTIPLMRLLEQLDAQSRTRVTLPGFTTAERDALDAAPGQIIYNQTTGKLNYYNGVTAAWEAITSA